MQLLSIASEEPSAQDLPTNKQAPPHRGGKPRKATQNKTALRLPETKAHRKNSGDPTLETTRYSSEIEIDTNGASNRCRTKLRRRLERRDREEEFYACVVDKTSLDRRSNLCAYAVRAEC